MLNPDFRDMLSCLKSAEVEFIVVGAYALAAHGLPRATGDIDIFVNASIKNAHKVLRALREFGAPASEITVEDLTAPDNIFQLGVAPCRIDLLTSIDGVTFDEAWRNRLRVAVDDLEIYVLSKNDLLKNKLAAARDKDKSDIAWLKKNP